MRGEANRENSTANASSTYKIFHLLIGFFILRSFRIEYHTNRCAYAGRAVYYKLRPVQMRYLIAKRKPKPRAACLSRAGFIHHVTAA